MTKLRYVGVEPVQLADVAESELNANTEDDATYQRLVAEIRENGVLELPVMLRRPDGSQCWLAGHHRQRAMRENGIARHDVVVFEGDPTPEELFNYVNNLNRVRGSLSTRLVVEAIRTHGLDWRKIDIFNLPVASLAARTQSAPTRVGDAKRKAELRDLSIRLSATLAEIVLDDLDAAAIVVRVEDKIAAILKVSVNRGTVRAELAPLKVRLQQAVDAWAAEVESGQ